MKILCSGGAGFLGSILVPALLDDGHHVTVLDNFRFGQASLNHVCGHPLFDVVNGDARDHNTVSPLLAKADVVIPLAALVGAPLCDSDWLAAESTNTIAIDMLARIMSPDQMMIIPITNSGYGVGEPGKECTEETPMRPISLYARTKVNAEEIALQRENVISFRLATAFGMSPRMRVDLLLNDFVYRAVTDRAVTLFEAHFKRNFIHVLDIASVFLHGIDNFEAMRGRPYNVGLSTANLSKLELCERIKQHVPAFTFHEAAVGEDVDKRDYVVANARIEATGWHPSRSLDDGILELIKGYRMLRNTRYGNV